MLRCSCSPSACPAFRRISARPWRPPVLVEACRRAYCNNPPSNQTVARTWHKVFLAVLRGAAPAEPAGGRLGPSDRPTEPDDELGEGAELLGDDFSRRLVRQHALRLIDLGIDEGHHDFRLVEDQRIEEHHHLSQM